MAAENKKTAIMENKESNIPKRSVSCIVDSKHKVSAPDCKNAYSPTNVENTCIEEKVKDGLESEQPPKCCIPQAEPTTNVENKVKTSLENKVPFIEKVHDSRNTETLKNFANTEKNACTAKAIRDYSCYVKVQDICSLSGNTNAFVAKLKSCTSCSVIVDARDIYPSVKTVKNNNSASLKKNDITCDNMEVDSIDENGVKSKLEEPFKDVKSSQIEANSSTAEVYRCAVENKNLESISASKIATSSTTSAKQYNIDSVTFEEDKSVVAEREEHSDKVGNSDLISKIGDVAYDDVKCDSSSLVAKKVSTTKIDDFCSETPEKITNASGLVENSDILPCTKTSITFGKEPAVIRHTQTTSVEKDDVREFSDSSKTNQKVTHEEKTASDVDCPSKRSNFHTSEKEICSLEKAVCMPISLKAQQGVICKTFTNQTISGVSETEHGISCAAEIEEDIHRTLKMKQAVSCIGNKISHTSDIECNISCEQVDHINCSTEQKQDVKYTMQMEQAIYDGANAEQSAVLGEAICCTSGTEQSTSSNDETKQYISENTKMKQDNSYKADVEWDKSYKPETEQDIACKLKMQQDEFIGIETQVISCRTGAESDINDIASKMPDVPYTREIEKDICFSTEKAQDDSYVREAELDISYSTMFQDRTCMSEIQGDGHAIGYNKYTGDANLDTEKACKHKIEQDEFTVFKKLKLMPEVYTDGVPPIECLNASTISKGMLLLGCITEIADNGLKLSLPGCQEGIVSLGNISPYYEGQMDCSSQDQAVVEPSAVLHSMFYLGQILPCRVLSVVIHPVSYKSTISLSINPVDVNCNLCPGSLYHNMVLHATVKCCEEEGYLMDVGIVGLSGFISRNDVSSQSQHQYEMIVGQVIPTLVQLHPEPANIEVVHLVPHPKFKAFPAVLESNKLSVSSLLPGTVIRAFVQESSIQGLLMNCMGYEGCIWKNHLPMDLIPECLSGTEVLGTVLYIHPQSHLIYLTLSEMMAYEQRMKIIYSYRKWDLIENAIVKHAEPDFISLDLGDNIKGHAFKKDFPDPDNPSTSDFVVGSLHRCCVVAVHPLDSLVRVTLRRSVLSMKFIKFSELSIGSIFTGKVYKFAKNGMVVKLSPNIQGFVPDILITDGPMKHPDMLFKLGTILACRIVSFDATVKPYMLHLTCKKQLCDPCLPILVSYNNAYPGFVTKGVVINISPNYIVLLFFNDVQGIVPNAHIENEGANLQEMYFLGQVLRCQVTYCDPTQKVLHLSLKDVFQEINSSVFPPLGVGKISDVRVKSASATGFHVQFPTSDVTAFLPHSHLTDIEDHAFTHAQLHSKNDILRVLIFRTRGCIIVTQKPSFVQLAQQGLLQQQHTNLYIGKVVPVVVKEFHSNMMTVDLGNDVIGYVPKRLIKDGVLENTSECGYSRGQTLVAKVLPCGDPNKIKLSTRVSDVYSRNPAYSLDALQMYLDDKERVREFYAECDGPSRDFANLSVGAIVSAKIKYVTSERVCYELENGVRGFTSVLNWDQNLELGISHPAAVLYVDSHSYKVEVSFSQRLVQNIINRRDGECPMVKPGDIVRGRAVFMCKEFVLASLEGHAAGLFAYIPCRKVINDTIGRHRLYTMGQKYSIFIKKVSSDKIFGVLEKHQKLYEQELLKARQEKQSSESVVENDYSQTAQHPAETLPAAVDDQSNVTSAMPTVSSDVNLSVEESNSLKCIGNVHPAVILSVRKLQVNVLITPNLRGRIHVTNMGCLSEGEYPLKRFSKNMEINVRIIGFNTRKNHDFSGGNDQFYEEFAECKPDDVSYVEPINSYSVGQNVVGFIKEIDGQYITVSLGVKTLAKLPILHVSNRTKDLRSVKKHYKLGQSVESRVWIAHKENIVLTKFGSWDLKQGHRVSALIQFCSRDQGITVKLPHGYTGEIAITDVSDDYNSTDHCITKFLEQRYIQCFVLEVDNYSKSCMLSTRASRLFGTSEGIIDKEITPFDVYRGQYYRGFVKVMTPISMHLNLGRKFEGIVKLHRFSEEEKDALKIDYPVGSIMLIVIKSVTPRMIQCQMVKRSGENESPHSSRMFISEASEQNDETYDEASHCEVYSN